MVTHCWKLAAFLYNIYLSLSHTLTDCHVVNITYLLFHCSECLSGIWMKPSLFSIRSSRELSPHDLARYGDMTILVVIYCKEYVLKLYSHPMPAIRLVDT